MTPTEAAKLLELPDHVTPEQIEARFHELRTKLEDKIAKAPTPGLKAKYRESLDEITQAFETLALAADSSALPVLRREQGAGSKEQGRGMEAGGGRPEAGGPASLRAAGAETGDRRPEAGAAATSPRKKSGGMEFILVAIIAVLVLAAGGWWVMKTRAENAEKARIAAEAKVAAEAKATAEKIEADRKAAEERRLAEEKRQAEEAEKARVAAAAKAEQERQEKLMATTRTKVAALKVAWEALEQEARQIERKLGELKSDERNLVSQRRDAAPIVFAPLRAEIAGYNRLSDWIGRELLRHPAKVSRVQGEELLAARQADEAAATIARAEEEMARLEREFADNRRTMLALTGRVSLKAGVADATWKLVDAYGREQSGTGDLPTTDLPVGPISVTFTHRAYTTQTREGRVTPDGELVLDSGMRLTSIDVKSWPAGAELWIDGKLNGRLPRRVAFYPGQYRWEVRLAGHRSQTREFLAAESYDTNSYEWEEGFLFLSDDNGDPGFTLHEDWTGFAYANADSNAGVVAVDYYIGTVDPDGPAVSPGFVPFTMTATGPSGDRVIAVRGADGQWVDIRDPFKWTSFEVSRLILVGRPGDTLTLRYERVQPGQETPEVREASVVRGRRGELRRRFAEWVLRADPSALETFALGGRPEAAFMLGDWFLSGRGGKIDYEQARKWYDVAKAGNAAGLGARLYLLETRTSVAPYTKAQIRELLRQDALAGDALSVLCWLESRRRDPELEPLPPPRVAAAVDEATQLAAQGQVVFQLMLAAYYTEAADRAKSRELAEQALAAGNLRALRFLAYDRLRDNQNPAALAAGLDLLRRAAAANDTAAMTELGQAYAYSGYGLAKDEQEALRWWRLAAAQEHDDAQLHLGYAYFLGRGVPADKAAGLAWWAKAAAAGNSTAMNELGVCLLHGNGVAQDHATALKWLRQAAEAKHAKAYLNLGYAALNGWGVSQSDAEAVNWWRKSAAKEDPYALANLAWAAANGRGMPQNEGEALNYWQRAARAGHEGSQKILRDRGLSW